MKDSPQFNSVYLEFKPLAEMIAKRFCRTSRVPYEELESQLSEEIWIAYLKFKESKGASLSTWMNTRLRDRAKRVVSRNEGKHYARMICITDYGEGDQKSSHDESNARTFEVVDGNCNVEKEALLFADKKEADQRELIDFLVNDPSQVDHDTTRIVSQFYKYSSIAALAKALGMHHEVVKRKLRRLSGRYDANRFGDINEYLAV
ncbi:hypothetical protein GCM10008915_36600 [Bifidobacterium pullorum subsp. gallinarum]